MKNITIDGVEYTLTPKEVSTQKDVGNLFRVDTDNWTIETDVQFLRENGKYKAVRYTDAIGEIWDVNWCEPLDFGSVDKAIDYHIFETRTEA